MYVASWSTCFFNYPSVKINDPSNEELEKWLLRIFYDSQKAFTLIFNEPSELTVKEAKRIAYESERGRDSLSLAKAYISFLSLGLEQVDVGGEPFKKKGIGVISSDPPFIKKTVCDIEKKYLLLFGARVSDWAISRLRDIKGINELEKIKQPTKDNFLYSKTPLWLSVKDVVKAYPELKTSVKGRKRG